MNARNRSRPIEAWVLAGAALLAACGSSDGTTSEASNTSPTTPTTISAVAPDRTITVDATGIARGVPDTMSLTLAVELQAPSTREVLDAVETQSTALRQALIAAGVPEEELQTTQLSVYPTYGGYTETGIGSIVGYTATVSLTVRTADLSTASSLVDGAAAAVGDALRVNGLMWSISNSAELIEIATADAVDTARVQAAQLAEASGLTLGAIISVTETTPMNYGYGYGEGNSSSIPYDPGTGTVQVSVSVTFAAS